MPQMNPIDQAFDNLRAKIRRAFMPFITAGDPDLKTTSALIHELARSGATLIEVGFPYSDPIADGPTIQASYTRALASHLTLDAIFGHFREHHARVAGEQPVPLVAMVSYALLLRRGPERFIGDAQGAGFSGAIVPDLPLEESQALARLAREREFKLIFLVTPTTPLDRARRIAEASTGFLYFVSVTGITGERRELPPQLKSQLSSLRETTKIPVCVGFGISTPEQVRALRDYVDGIIVGSALVRPLEQVGKRPVEQIVAEIGKLAHGFSDALVT
jgi:tryptophan synthase alpha chain